MKQHEDFARNLRQELLELLPLYLKGLGGGVGTKIKPDDTPVGSLDHHALNRIRSIVNTYFPGERSIGEEDGIDAPEMGKIVNITDQYQNTIDGLDGTGNMGAGLTSYGAMFSRRLGNEIDFAAGFLPIYELISGRGFFWTRKNPREETRVQLGEGTSEAISTARSRQLPRMLVMLEGSSKRLVEPPILDLKRVVATRSGFSSVAAAISVAQGLASAVVTIGNKPWDNWPAVGLIEGAGGIVTDFFGNRRDLSNCGNMIAAGNEEILEKILKIMNPLN